ncbi:MAG TPA: NusG domain II-containing protein [Candidatus Cloacimonadota bacterium]|nr:NusG domain II-containing protein [Candidatus Cloacimonadota bacterium]
MESSEMKNREQGTENRERGTGDREQEMEKRQHLLKRVWRRLTYSDKILIFVLILISIAMTFLFPHHRKQGIVEVYQNNEMIAEYPLDKDRQFEILPGCNAEIKDGKVRMLNSPCKNKLCVKQGWSDFAPIVCMPEKVSLIIRNDNQKNQIHLLY